MSPQLGRFLKALRTSAAEGHITVTEAAKRSGVARQTIHKWEGGEAKPEPEHIRALCEAYGAQPEQLDRALRLRAEPDPNSAAA